MHLKYLFPLCFFALTACRTTTSTSLKGEETSVNPPIKFSTSVVSLETFKEYDPGALETSSSFPRLYILLPKLTPLDIKNLTISGKIRGTNGTERSISAVYGNGEWSSVGSDIKYITEGLLGLESPKLELTISGDQGEVLVSIYDLTRAVVINPFVDLQLLKIDFSNIPWQTKAGRPEPGVSSGLKSTVIAQR
jgi:hypothetical protein